MRNIITATALLLTTACSITTGAAYREPPPTDEGRVILYRNPIGFNSYGGFATVTINGRDCTIDTGEFTVIDTPAGTPVELVYDVALNPGRSAVTVAPMKGQTLYVKIVPSAHMVAGVAAGGAIGGAVGTMMANNTPEQTSFFRFVFGDAEEVPKTTNANCS